jgi:hypothetical protein
VAIVIYCLKLAYFHICNFFNQDKQ